MIWLATLVVWPSPLPPTSVMFLPISSKSGFNDVERGRRAADHDRERCGLRADFAAGDRRIEVVAAERVDALGELLRLDRRDRAHVDHDLARRQPAATPSVAEQHLLDVRRVRHHDEDHVGAAARPRCRSRTTRRPPQSVPARTPLRDAGTA